MNTESLHFHDLTRFMVVFHKSMVGQIQTNQICASDSEWTDLS